jgi:BTB/POZ domain-containing protein KCTD9
MNSERASRLSYEESCKYLQRYSHLGGGAEGVIPPLSDHRPQYDDELPFGVRFFRTWLGVGRPFGLKALRPEDDVEVAEHALDNLTLPRTYFGRSEISSISFQNTNLSDSTICWNDFIKVNFTDADLSESDLRASAFTLVAFVRTDLRNSDLRRSSFEGCDFTDADMRGAKLTHEQGEDLDLSEKQRQEIDWQDSDGDEPPGG